MAGEPTTEMAVLDQSFALPSRSHVQATLQQVEEFRALIQSELREGPDYGTIPGTSKPTLLKPGAEKITKLLGLADTYEITDKTAEWEMGLFQYEVRCSLVSIRTGQIVAQGVGECNSYESKYRYREANAGALSAGPRPSSRARSSTAAAGSASGRSAAVEPSGATALPLSSRRRLAVC